MFIFVFCLYVYGVGCLFICGYLFSDDVYCVDFFFSFFLLLFRFSSWLYVGINYYVYIFFSFLVCSCSCSFVCSCYVLTSQIKNHLAIGGFSFWSCHFWLIFFDVALFVLFPLFYSFLFFLIMELAKWETNPIKWNRVEAFATLRY